MANNPELLKMPLARDGQKSTIPETTDASTGLFSQQYGWQSINSLPPQAGGKAVKREDFNGAFNLLGGIAFMAQKGFTFKWSAEQDYYAGCVVIDDTDGLRYECIADVTANSTAPSADATHWQLFKAGTDIDAWFRQASTVYVVGDLRCYESLPYGWYLECTTAGTTGSGGITLPNPLAENATIADGAVVWKVRKIGLGEELTVVDSIAPTSNRGTVAETINGIANMLKQIKGDSDWKTAPVISLTSILSNLGTNFEVTTNESTGVFSVPALGITGLMAQNGYISLGRLFGGLILQWGRVGSGSQSIPFNIAFTSSVYTVVGIGNYNSGGGWVAYYDYISSWNLNSVTYAASYPRNWIAIGR